MNLTRSLSNPKPFTMSWDSFIRQKDYDGLLTFIDSSDEKRKKGLNERSMRYFIDNDLLQYFMKIYSSLADCDKNKENVLTLLLDYYYKMNDIEKILTVIFELEKREIIKRRHLIRVLDFYFSKAKLDDSELFQLFEIFFFNSRLLFMEDFQKFFNLKSKYNNEIFSCIKDRRLSFDNLSLNKSKVSVNVCQCCGECLSYSSINVEKLINSLILINKMNDKTYTDFAKFICNKDYDVVVDCANIFYYILQKKDPVVNKSSFDFLGLIVNNLKAMGYKKPLLVLHNRHKKAAKKYNCEKIFTDNLTHWTPSGMNDDHFSLISCWVKHPMPIVTCDVFRDHKNIDNDLIDWYEDMHISYDARGRLTDCVDFSPIVQISDENVHLPALKKGQIYCIAKID